MQLMTFNLRFENDYDKENGWEHRRDMVIDLIRKYRPSILGTQEGIPRQLQFILDQLPEYRVHAPSNRAPDDETCQYPTIFYRRDVLTFVSGGEFWLSTAPEVHRSKNWDSAFPRLMSYALCRCVQTGIPFWVAVTHLDNIGVEARRQQAGIISRWIRERSDPVILMGDFNDAPGSPAHRILTSSDCGLHDSWLALGRIEGEASMTHHGFIGKPNSTRIDWILLSSHFRVRDAWIIRDHCEGRYPSDHFPYMVECEFQQVENCRTGDRDA